jgi:HEAT repeat protein
MLWWTLIRLRSSDNRKRRQAVEQLAKVRNQRAVKPLICTVTDLDPEVRASALRALDAVHAGWEASHGARDAVPHLIAALTSPLADREAAIRALGRIGDRRAMPALTAAVLADEKPDSERQEAARALGYIGGSAVIDSLRRALSDRARDVRRTAALALTEIGWSPIDNEQRASHDLTVGRWDRLLEYGDGAAVAVQALLKRPDNETRVKLLELAASPTAAAQAIVTSLGAAAVNAIIPLLGTEAFETQAADALVAHKEVAVIPLMQGVTRREGSDRLSWWGRRNAVRLLARIGDIRAIPTLIGALDDDVDEVRREACDSLEKWNPRCWPALDSTAKARYAVARHDWTEVRALGRLAVEPLLAHLNRQSSRQPVTSVKVIELLREIGDRRAADPLLSVLESSDEGVRMAAATAIATFKDNAILESLLRVLRGKHSSEKRGVARALLESGGAEEVREEILTAIGTGLELYGDVAAADSSAKSYRGHLEAFLSSVGPYLSYRDIVVSKHSYSASDEPGYDNESMYPLKGAYLWGANDLTAITQGAGYESERLKTAVPTVWLLSSGQLLSVETVSLSHRRSSSSFTYHRETKQLCLDIRDARPTAAEYRQVLRGCCRQLLFLLEQLSRPNDTQATSIMMRVPTYWQHCGPGDTSSMS